jgi:hypothetical protein
MGLDPVFCSEIAIKYYVPGVALLVCLYERFGILPYLSCRGTNSISLAFGDVIIRGLCIDPSEPTNR